MRMSEVRVEYIDTIVKARPATKLRVVENVVARPPSNRPHTRKSPVEVVTSTGDTLLFKDHRTAWLELRLPHAKMIKHRIACAFSSEAKITHGGGEYTFSFVEIC